MRDDMRVEHRSLGRALTAPGIVALIAASLLMGFTTSRETASRAEHAISRQVVRFDPVDSTRRSDTSPDPADPADMETDPVENYRAALALLKSNYYGVEIDDHKTRQLTYDAIRGMLDSLQDPFTSFLDPDKWQQFQATITRGDFEGIGAILEEDKPNIRVQEPIETGPAEKVGIKAGDVITRVNNAPIFGKNIDDVVKIIKGPSGTRVTITVLRGKQTLTFAITRARVEPPIVKYWMEDSKAKIGHIILEEFNEKSLDQLNRAFENLQEQGMRALVFDLRDNPGGLLEVAVQLASVFIPRNSVPQLKNNAVIIREGSGREQGRPLEPVDSAYSHRVPLVVLVNDNSASASEIVTGAIKDYGVGVVIGTRTYGKGCVQTLYPLDDGSCLRLTTALYFPPKHYDINYKQDEDHNRIPNTGGLLPDVAITQSSHWKSNDFLTDRDAANDTQLQAALDYLRNRLNGVTLPEAVQQVQTKYKDSNARLAAGNPADPMPPATRNSGALLPSP